MSAKDVFFADRTMRLSGALFLSIFLTAAACLGQHYPILPVPGSPHGIFTMMQDSRSALWLGTIDDVYCFDGEHFYSLRQYGFPKETPNSFAEDSEGGIWIGTQGTAYRGGRKQGGLYRYRAAHVEEILTGDILSVAPVASGLMLASVATEIDGGPAFGDLHLIRRSGDAWSSELLVQKAANHLTIDHQGNPLFPCPGGWCEIDRRDLIARNGPGSFLNLIKHPGSDKTERVLRDRFGCLWFRSESSASYQCRSDPNPVAVPFSISSYDSSAHLEETADGSIFMLVSMALGRPGAFHVATSLQGLPTDLDDAITSKDGTIWLGTNSGLSKFVHPFQIESWDASAGIDAPYSILRSGDSVFASARGGELRKLDRGRLQWKPVPHAGTSNIAIVVAPDGSLITASQATLAHLTAEGEPIKKIRFRQGITPALSLARGANQEIFLGLDGLNRVDFARGRLSLIPEDVPKSGINDLKFDESTQTLWGCDGKEVIFGKDGEWRRISQTDGLVDRPCTAIVVRPNGDVWVGYSSNAISLIRNASSGRPSVRNYTGAIEELAPDSSYRMLAIDRDDRLWRSVNALSVASPEAAEADHWLPLGANDGLRDYPAGNQSYYSETDGSIWFASRDGIDHLSLPADFPRRLDPPAAFVAGFSLGDGAAILADAIGTVPRNVGLTAHIGCLQFDRRNAIHLRYRLLPEQAAWQTASSFDLPLGKLRWGAHQLQVQAQLSTGPWAAISEASFTVLKPIWVTWPAIAGYLAAFFSSVFGIRIWRARRAVRAKKKFPELANWRLAALSPELNQLAGTIIEARFEVGPILARGGFATVARGRDLQQGGLHCAIKIFRQELMDKDWLARRFQHEVRALASIDHPNVVRIYGHGTTAAGTPYLVMEFIEGSTLRELLDRERISPRTTASYLRQTGSALDEIHAREICHRDLKPENLMVRNEAAPGKELVLIDFSIAIVKDPDETMHGLSRAAGTLYYMAPEQAIGYADPSTDIYSLAKIVIEMLTGRRLSDLLPNASMDLSERVRELLAGLPLRLSTVSIELLGSGLEFDPARRPKIAGIFANTIADDLEQASRERD